MSGQLLCQAELSVGFGYQQQTGIRRHLAAVETADNGLAAYRRKLHLKKRIGHWEHLRLLWVLSPHNSTERAPFSHPPGGFCNHG